MNKLKDVMSIEHFSRGDRGHLVTIGDTLLYFSYNTLIAMVGDDGQLLIIKNYWSSTTGNHLNSIDPDTSIRLDKDEFEVKVYQYLKGKGFI